MNNCICSLLLLCFTSFCHGQSPSSLSYGASISVDRPTLRVDRQAAVEDFVTTTSLTAHLDIQYRLSDKLQLISGLGYRRRAWSVLDYSPRQACNFTSDIDSYFDRLSDVRSLVIPLHARYDFITGEHRLYVRSGLALALVMQDRSSFVLYECGDPLVVEHTAFTNNPAIDLDISLGYEHQLDSDHKVFIQVQASQEINSALPSLFYSLSNASIRNYGIRIGVRT